MYLCAHTYYSYKYGTMSIEELLDEAQQLGHTHIAITDVNSTSAWWDALRLSAKRGIKLSLGIDFRNLHIPLEKTKGQADTNPNRPLYVGIAINEEGRHELNRFLSEHLMEKKPFPERGPRFDHAVVVYPWYRIQSGAFKGFNASHSKDLTAKGAEDIRKGHGGKKHVSTSHLDSAPAVSPPGGVPKGRGGSLSEHEFIGVAPEELNRFRLSLLGRKAMEDASLQERIVLLHPASFRHRQDFNVHRLLRSMDRNCLLSMLPPSEQGSLKDGMIAAESLKKHFEDFPWILENTQRLLSKTKAEDMEKEETLSSSKNLACYSSSKEEDERLIRALCEAGLPYRYPQAGPEVHERVAKELDIIIKQGFVAYFLINWDIVNYARKQGYFYVGRGSGANSVVAYLLRITDVDPIELDLYFERFINLFRSSPPDFDMDFSWADREDMTRYIFERFPTATLLGAYSTFQFRAARRELGKVFGLPPEEIETIGGQLRTGHFRPRWEKSQNNSERKTISLNHKGKLNEPMPQVDNDQLKQLVLKYTGLLLDRPSHLSIHAAGILIPDKPITYYTATFLPPKGFPTAQFSMLEAEDIGINKFDILSQRGLGKIKDALTLIRENHPEHEPIDIHDIRRFKKDEQVKQLLRSGDAIGCFYVESPAMRMLMRKLEVDDYLGLVAASSVIRPGVAQSGMMQEYILRKRHPERRQDAHPVMLDLMPETFGVMVYQEDVIKVAHYFAGLSLAEADVLRRGMSGKYRSRAEFQAVQEKFFRNCTEEKGYTMQLTQEIWRQIESFAGYAFAKGHSASYAVESYQSLFLKAYYPLEYMVATINNGGGFYTREHYIHEARMKGALIEGPCIQASVDLTRIEGRVIYLGFHLVKGLDQAVIDRIITQREQGDYESLADLLDRVPMGIEQLNILIRVGALRNINSNENGNGNQNENGRRDASLSVRVSREFGMYREQKAGGNGNQNENLNENQNGEEHPSPTTSTKPTTPTSPTKKELLWQAYGILEKKQKRHDEQMRLFRPPTQDYTLPRLDHQQVEDAFDEMEYLGFPLCHPFDLLREPIEDSIRLKDLKHHIGKTVTVYGYLVTAKNTKTKLGDRMNFGNFVDRDGDFLDTVHFPDVAARYPFRGKGVYAVTGKVVEEWEFQTIEVERMERLPYVDDPRYVEESSSEEMDKDVNRIITEHRKKRNEKMVKEQREKLSEQLKEEMRKAKRGSNKKQEGL